MKRVIVIAIAAATCATGLIDAGCRGTSASPGPPLTGDSSLQIDALEEQRRRWLSQGERTRARASFEHAKRVAESLDDRQAQAAMSYELGELAQEEGSLAQAIAFHRHGLDLAEELGDAKRIMLSAGALAAVEEQAGHREAAATLYERAMALARERQDRAAQAVLLNNMGLLQQRKGDAEAEMNRASGRREAEASNHVNLGLLAETQNELEQAAQIFTRALELDKEIEHHRGIAADLAHLARVAVRRGLTEAALEYLD